MTERSRADMGEQLRVTPSTFSIAAADLQTGEFGVAVASKFLAVGAVVPWARAGTGAIATQAWANLTYGPRGLALLADGQAAGDVVGRLTGADGDREHRQLGVVDQHGRAAAPPQFTNGQNCLGVHRLYFGTTPTGALTRAAGNVTREIQQLLHGLGYYSGEISGIYDPATKAAFKQFCSIENFEERWRDDDLVDREIVAFMRKRLASKASP